MSLGIEYAGAVDIRAGLGAESMAEQEIAVVKFGTSLVTNELGIDQDAINGYAEGLSKQYEGQRLIVVTSGAIATGKAVVTRMGRDPDTYKRVTLAQIGATRMTHAWENAFEGASVVAGGLLVTHHEIETHDEGRQFKKTVKHAGATDTVSVINHNDALSKHEIFKDNDELALHIARVIRATSLTLFTRRGGVTEEDGELINNVTDMNIAKVKRMLKKREQRDQEERKANNEVSNGTGGMRGKNKVAWKASKSGIYTRIAAVNEDMSGARVTEYYDRIAS